MELSQLHSTKHEISKNETFYTLSPLRGFNNHYKPPAERFPNNLRFGIGSSFPLKENRPARWKGFVSGDNERA